VAMTMASRVVDESFIFVFISFRFSYCVTIAAFICNGGIPPASTNRLLSDISSQLNANENEGEL